MRGRLLLALCVLATLLVVGRGVAEVVSTHAWYQAMGVPALFWETLIDQAALQGGAWLVGALFAFVNLHAVRRTILAIAVPVRVGNLELTTVMPSRRLTVATLVLALLIGGVLATPLTDVSSVALIRHGLPFGELEGITGRDLGFYVYWLPLEETLYLWSLLSVVTCTTVVLVLYALTRSLRVEGRRFAVSAHVRRHLSALAAIVLLLLAWSHRLDAFDVLQQGSGPDGLVLRVDHAVTLRMDRLLTVLSLAAALVVLRTGWMGQLRSAMITLGVVLAAAVGLRHVVPLLAAQGSWLGDPARRESDYVAARALFSRRAFASEAIRPLGDSLADSTSAAWRVLSLWDPAAVRAALPIGEDRGTGGDEAPVEAIGWTASEGRIDVLAGRPSESADGRWTWWRLAPAGREREREGRPLAEPLEGIPSALGVAPGATRPLVLPLENAGEVPAMPLVGWRDRVLHAWALREPQLIAPETHEGAPSALVTHRDVRTRIERLAPVFVQGSVVTPIRVADRLFWIVHLYSASDRYPISQRWAVAGGTYGYFHLAATAIVEAATGRVALRGVPAPDPVARSWMRQVPTLFADAPWVPRDLMTLLPVPVDQALVQLRTFSRYGARFDGETPRLLADSAWSGGPPSSHLLSDRGSLVPGWALPVVDAGGMVVGIMRAIGGGSPRLEWQPVRTPPPRWEALRAGTSGLEDSLRFALSEELRATARLVVTRPALVVHARRPVVVRAARAIGRTGRLDAMRVAVSDGVRVGVGRSLDEASRRALLALPGATEAGVPPDLTDPLGRSAEWYSRMRDAMRRGDWPAFGAAFDSLGEALRRRAR